MEKESSEDILMPVDATYHLNGSPNRLASMVNGQAFMRVINARKFWRDIIIHVQKEHVT